MPKASVKRTINCSKEDLINLVLNIEDYPKFIPYCLNAKIYEKKKQGCSYIILSKLFSVDYAPSEKFYGIVKFNLIKNQNININRVRNFSKRFYINIV